MEVGIEEESRGASVTDRVVNEEEDNVGEAIEVEEDVQNDVEEEQNDVEEEQDDVEEEQNDVGEVQDDVEEVQDEVEVEEDTGVIVEGSVRLSLLLMFVLLLYSVL